MRCPACDAPNAPDAVQCAACNAPLQRRPARKRDRSEDPDSPFGVRAEGSNLSALRAYRLSLYGLIPVVGLVLGPTAVLLGAWAARRGRRDPTFTARGPAVAAVIIGTIDSLTNWAGVGLMILGIKSMFAS
jgi:hypothetical protein